MLQQTQVATVISYYEKFMQRFPDVSTLANASEDEVLYLWAGLGYYSRARNLHRAAKIIVDDYDGYFPDRYEDLIKLPGIGKSTAGAILSIAFKIPTAILDGNVKRVLARLHAISARIDEKETETLLWDLANYFTPSQDIAYYTQAMMDLGATICTPNLPKCNACPLTHDCLANKNLTAHLIPVKKSKKQLPTRTVTFLILQLMQDFLLYKRNQLGVWQGLWSFPEISGEPNQTLIQAYCHKHYHLKTSSYQTLSPFRHTFTHYHLIIHPILIVLKKPLPPKIMTGDVQIWYNPTQPITKIGLPKPVQSILRSLV